MDVVPHVPPSVHRACGAGTWALSLGVCLSVLHKSWTFLRTCAHGIQALSVGPQERSLFMSSVGIDGSHTAQWLHCPTQNDPLVNCHQTCSPRHLPPQLASPPLSRRQDKTCKSPLAPHTAPMNRLHELRHLCFFSAAIPVPCPTPQSCCKNSPAGSLSWPLPSADRCPSAAKYIPSRWSPDYNLSVQGFHAMCLPGDAQGPWLPPRSPLSSLCSGKSSERPHLFPPQASLHLLSSLPTRFLPYLFMGPALHPLSLSSSGTLSGRSPLITPSEAHPFIPTPASCHCHS